MRLILIFTIILLWSCGGKQKEHLFEEDGIFKVEKAVYYEYAQELKEVFMKHGLLIDTSGNALYGAFKYVQKFKGTTYKKINKDIRSELVAKKAKYSELTMDWDHMFLENQETPLQIQLKKALGYLNSQPSLGIEEISIAFLGFFSEEDYQSEYLQSVLLIQLNQVMHDYYWNSEKKRMLPVQEDDAISWDQISLSNHGFPAKKVLTIEPVSMDSLYYKSELLSWSAFEDTLNKYNDSLMLRAYFDGRMPVEQYIQARQELEKRCKGSEAYLYMRAIRNWGADKDLSEKELNEIRKRYEIAILEI